MTDSQSTLSCTLAALNCKKKFWKCW